MQEGKIFIYKKRRAEEHKKNIKLISNTVKHQFFIIRLLVIFLSFSYDILIDWVVHSHLVVFF